MAVAFAKRGAAVVISGRSTDKAPNRGGLPGTLESVEAELRDFGGQPLSVAADLSRTEAAADTRRREPSGAGVQQLPYSATKAAIEALSFGLAHQLADSGVSVNCVRPSVATEAVTFHAPHLLDDPSGRWVRPDDYGDAMVWLAEQPSDYTGNLLTNDDLKALGVLTG
jgi:NAD(P)-dependent dehydrogenase (short-subunit alcohol dehydrogenase family)